MCGTVSPGKMVVGGQKTLPASLHPHPQDYLTGSPGDRETVRYTSILHRMGELEEDLKVSLVDYYFGLVKTGLARRLSS